ncbi:MAG: hypothetical protein IT377_17960 [Polyangiaceae bacterium]|nr:hypothetical protein [Polyangiaceae bacterium]
MRRLIAIALVWLGCSLAWLVLGSTLLVRSDESSARLGDGVNALWGPPIRQLPPRAFVGGERPDGSPKTTRPRSDVPLTGSAIDVVLDLEHRKKGLVWFPTYAVDFRARYSFANPDAEPREVSFELPLESEHALYDGFVVSDGDRPVSAEVTQGVARWTAQLGPNEKKSYEVRYRSRGTSRWQYDLTAGTGSVRDFRLSLATDFDEVNFLPGTLSPSKHEASGTGWRGSWEFSSLVASSPIGLSLPERLNPGPLASKITFFAPVSLLFFFFVVAILAHAQNKQLHPLHYLFLGCAFFAFHLLFSYLVDHVSIAPSFAIAAAVSIALVVSYGRLFVGWRFAVREMGLAQLIYLVLFSFSFFFSGFTGLSITVGAILTLFVLMQITGRRDLSGEARDPKIACAQPYRCAAAAEAGPVT